MYHVIIFISDRATALAAAEKAIHWVEENASAEKEEFMQQLQKVETACKAIMTKLNISD